MNPKRRQPKAVTVLLLALIVGAILPALSQAAFNQTEQDLQTKASFLISTFNTANVSVTQTFSNLEAEATAVPPNSLAAFSEAQLLHSQSILLNQEGNFSEAIELALQALQKLKETLSDIYEAVNETLTSQEITYQKTVEMQNEIARSFELLLRLEKMTESVANHGTDIAAITPKLATIKADLDSAASFLSHGNLSQAQIKIHKAKTSIKELTEYFDSYAVNLKVERVAAYVSDAEQRLETLKSEVTSVSNQMSSTVQVAASNAITQAEKSLTRAKQYLDNQQISQTIDELKTVKTSEDAIENYVNSVTPSPTPTPTSTPSLSNRSSASNVNASVSARSVLP